VAGSSVSAGGSGDSPAGITPDEAPLGSWLVERSISKRSATATDEVHRIIEATFDVIADSQSSEPSLREVLRRAKLSTATFYRHFRSRDELLFVVLDEGSSILASYLSHRMASKKDPLAKIAAWIEGFLHQAVAPTAADRTRPFAVGSPRIDALFPSQTQRLERLVKLLEQQIVAGNELGLCDCADPARDALAIFDYIHAAMIRHLLARSVPSKATMEYLTELTLRVIGAAP
jgi:AcrR family transcriptional regulator